MRRFPRSRVSAPERRRLREEVREVDFGTAMRGYDRAAVDRYVEYVNRLIAELEISSSPESAIRNALDEVSEETSGLLQRAYETAEEITARSRAKADDRVEQANREAEELRETAAREATELSEGARRKAAEMRAVAKREAEEMVAAAEARVRELEREAETIWRERRRLIDDMTAVAHQQREIAEAAAARFPGQAPADEPADDGEPAPPETPRDS
jgi:DivIVA domain-containing protein